MRSLSLHRVERALLHCTGALSRIGNGADRRLVAPALLHLYRTRTPRIRFGQRLLFVCEGNICRSPVAAALARQLLRDNLADASSAGLGRDAGRPAPEAAVNTAARMGLDLHEHRSVSVRADQIQRADCVFVMDRLNLTRAWRRFPEVRRKLFLLDAPHEIVDPYGQPEESFRRTFDQIHRSIEKLSRDVKGG